MRTVSLLLLQTVWHAVAAVCLFLALGGLSACTKTAQNPTTNGAFLKASEPAAGDLDECRAGGELLVATMSGPDTYFEYRGRQMGTQFALVEDFAISEGLRVSISLVTDTASLIQMLRKGEVDVVALPLPRALLEKNGLQAAGFRSDSLQTAWVVRGDQPQLREALEAWWGGGARAEAVRTEAVALLARSGEVRRHVRASFISREKGIISPFDDLFKRAAVATGWDWRLIAAQCYVESGFDETAVSWAGARGLMQLMPATAESLGIKEADVFLPSVNVDGAARVIRQLSASFKDIPSAEERVKFVLASYNGGIGHIRDAMALARSEGRDSRIWANVAPYVLRLSEPQGYRSPVVKHGFMLGRETVNYVASVVDHFRAYGGSMAAVARPMPDAASLYIKGTSHTAAPEAVDGDAPRNRFAKESRILSPEELEKSR